jgi:4-amino-4-deoxy-L-arabinose transferase-like glycosyltransferase
MGKEKVERAKSSDSGLAVVVFAAWALLLLIAFLAYRGADAGQFPRLLGNLGGGPPIGDSGVKGIFGWVIATLIFRAWYGLGSLISSFIKTSAGEDTSIWLRFAQCTAIGAAAWSLIWFLLGLAGLYKPVSAIVLLVVGIGLSIWQPGRSPKTDTPAGETFKWTEKALLAVICVPLVLAAVAALAPPIAKDTLLYHFALPKAFIAQGGIAPAAGNIASYLALGTEMHTVWAMLLGGLGGARMGEAAAGATIFLFFPLLLIAIYGWARELGIEKRWALIGVLIVAAVPTAYHVASSAYIDLALALFITLAIQALGRWWKTLETGWLIYAAIFLGAALSAKLTALFVFAAFALVILLRARQAKEDAPAQGSSTANIFATGFVALLIAGAIASPWYLKTWKQTGSPIFPFYMSFWKGEAAGWDVERSALFQAMNSQYGGYEKNIVDYVLSPFRISVLAQPEQAPLFDGVIGVAFLIGLPVLIWALWKFELPAEVKVGAGVCGIMFLFWLFSSQQVRYLLPVLPALAVGICAAGQAISREKKALAAVWQFSLIASALAALVTGAAWFLQKAPLRVVVGGESRDEYLARNIDYYPYYQVLNTETPPDSRVWLINMRRDTYNLDRPYFSDYLFEDWTLKEMVWSVRSAAELKRKVQERGFNYVLVRHDFLLDYKQSSILKDDKPGATPDEKEKTRKENEEKLKIAKEFLLDKAATIKADEKFSLVKVF